MSANEQFIAAHNGAFAVPVSDGSMTLVDGDMADLVLAAGPWHAVNGGKSIMAKITESYVPNKGYKYRRLHAFVLGDAPPGMVIDHVDGNPRNNTRANLRFATFKENARNSRKKESNPTSKYKGVTRQGKKFAAIVNTGGVYVRSSPYSTEAEAAVAYDQIATLLFGKFAKLNDVKTDRPVNAVEDIKRRASRLIRGNQKILNMLGDAK